MTASNNRIERYPYNAAVDFIDANVAKGFGNKVGYTDALQQLTYGALQDATDRFANALRALGLRQEDRIILLLLDTVAFPTVFWGAVRAGIIPVPLNSVLTTEEYAFVLDDSRADAIVIAQELFDVIEPVLNRAAAKHVIAVNSGDRPLPRVQQKSFYRFEDILAAASPKKLTCSTVSDEVAFWLYSSGSTGYPKAVKHIQTTLMETARAFGQQVLGITADDVLFSSGKLFFAYGLANSLAIPMSVGAHTILVPDRLTPDLVIATMRKHHPTVFFGGPALYAALLAHEDICCGLGSDRLRICVSGGDTLPKSVGERWCSIVGVEIVEGAGATEILTFLSNRPGSVRYGTPGRPLPGFDAKILGPDGQVLGTDEPGELAVRGATNAEGYWNQRAKTLRTFVGEWVHTGDIYRRDKDGFYHFCGRNDDMFKVGGVWVSPLILESALLSHEAVLATAVIGCTDNDGTVKPKAFVVLKKGNMPTQEMLRALRAHIKDRLVSQFAQGSAQSFYAYYPRWIEFCNELPRTSTGKIQRFKLRERAG